MTATLRGEGVADHRAETDPATAHRATSLVTLDLTGTHPPRPPRGIVKPVVATRVPPAHEYALRRRADELGVTVSDLLRDLIEAELLVPPDVRGWLLMQQRQCSALTEAETITLVVRHLARRWPNGCRLAD